MAHKNNWRGCGSLGIGCRKIYIGRSSFYIGRKKICAQCRFLELGCREVHAVAGLRGRLRGKEWLVEKRCAQFALGASRITTAVLSSVPLSPLSSCGIGMKPLVFFTWYTFIFSSEMNQLPSSSWFGSTMCMYLLE